MVQKNYKTMEKAVANARLGILSQEEIGQAVGEKSLTSYDFNFAEISANGENYVSQVRLEIRPNFLLQMNPNDHSIICGFAFDYSVNFEIVRNHSEAPNTLGLPEGIQFIFTSEEKRRITLLLRKQTLHAFYRFMQVLEKRYLVQQKFHHCFKALKILGKGVTATVYKAVRHEDKKQVAIKSFKRATYFETQNGNGKKAFQKEFKIMTEVRHPNVIDFLGVYESENSTYIIMEFLEISLFHWLQKFGFPPLSIAKKIISQLLRGLKYLHDKGFMHRDLKLENIMIRKDSKENVSAVIVDLGLAEEWENEKYLYNRCGTPGYVAPEILKINNTSPEKYNSKVDIFSLGVIFHMLVFKKSVFEGADVKEVIKKNTTCEIDFSNPYFSDLDAPGLDLIKKMLEKDPKKRITAHEALEHEFLKEVLKEGNEPTESNIVEPIESKI